MAARRIAVVTGTRAEYGLLKSTMTALQRRRGCALRVIAAGMHLLKKFGSTIDDIRRDGFEIAATVRMQRGDDHSLDQARGIAAGVRRCTDVFNELRPDLVLVLGDRIEPFAAATAARAIGIRLAHIHGGDVAPGDIDDHLRNAISMLADLHFPATRAAAKRLQRMGADPERIHTCGAPGLDRLRELIERQDRTSPSADRNPPLVIVHHPIGRSPGREQRAMRAVLAATRKVGLPRVVIYPNSDRGHKGIIDAIDAERLRRADRRDDIRTVRSLDRDDFLNLLLDAAALVGNSSAGMIEAPFAGTPVVNVGARQTGRQRGDRRMIVDTPENSAAIHDAIQRAVTRKRPPGRRTVYGDGNVGERIARLLLQQA